MIGCGITIVIREQGNSTVDREFGIEIACVLISICELLSKEIVFN